MQPQPRGADEHSQERGRSGDARAHQRAHAGSQDRVLRHRQHSLATQRHACTHRRVADVQDATPPAAGSRAERVADQHVTGEDVNAPSRSDWGRLSQII